MSKIIDLKGSILSLTVLNLFSDQIDDTKQAIAAKIGQAPDFFVGIPIVLEPQIELKDPTFLALLVEYLTQQQMIPIGIRTEERVLKNRRNMQAWRFSRKRRRKLRAKVSRKRRPKKPV